MWDPEFILLFLYTVFHTGAANYDPNMDRTLFEIKWPGITDVNLDEIKDDQNVVVMTKDNEKYKCVLPETVISSTDGDLDSYKGPTEFELIETLMDQTSCSYRIEAYWTYELCHGKHLRQYHEEKEMGKQPKLQEYYLGTFDRYAAKAELKSKAADLGGDKDDRKETKTSSTTATKRVEGVEVPYYEMIYTGGTVCDLTHQHRKAYIHYTCHLEGKGEIYEIKESASCEYEVVILTNVLCSHPGYAPPKEPVNYIQCQPLEESPEKPKSLVEFEAENSKGKYNKRQEVAFERVHKKTGTTFYQKQVNQVNQQQAQQLRQEERQPAQAPTRTPDTIGAGTDRSLLKEFLSGDFCIRGGTGWWKHEFCYGKKVIQFHEDKNGKTVVLLGTWDEAAHIQWLEDNPSKKPKPASTRKSISHYYGNGETCDLTGKPRFTEVKLKCKENSAQPHAVAIYLVEPNACEYIVVVESPILCRLIVQADKYGLIPTPDL